MLFSLNKKNFNTFLINSLFVFIPISFIAGNLILNINILLFIFSTIYFHGKNILNIKFIYLDKLIIIFFGYVLFTGFLNTFFFSNTENGSDYAIMIKTIFYFRFLIFYFAIRILIEKKIINFKTFLILCSICSYFVCLDLIYQFNFGNDIFGFTSNDPRRFAGPFGDEYIAGSYLQRFAIFTFFLILFFFKGNDKINLAICLISTFILISIGLIIAGNRIPLFLFLVLVFCVFLFNKVMRKYLLGLLLSTLVIFGISFSYNQNIKDHLGHFYKKAAESVNFFSTVIIKDKKSVMKDLPNNVKGQYEITVNGKLIQIPNNYIKEFNTGYQTWKQNKFIGGGINSFRKNCANSGKSLNILNCSNHPHNYYLEILSELGIIGFVLLIFIFSKVFYDILIKRYMSDYRFKKNDIIIPFMFLLFLEIFPIRTTGSFFTTGNATYIFLIMAITIALSQSNDKKN